MFAKSYLDTAAAIIAQYNGSEPLAAFLKKFFAGQKKYGSRDRRQISNLCYAYFRLGAAMPYEPVADRLLVGLFLCSNTSQPLLQQLQPSLRADLPLPEKISQAEGGLGFSLDSLFPFADYLSPQIDREAFNAAFLVQPDTFLRLRPGKKERVLQQMEDAGITYRLPTETSIGVPPAAKLDELLMFDRDVVVQDLSSQQVLSLLLYEGSLKGDFSAWDCCAASGGKSLLMHDLFPKAKLTVSDIRTSILANLRKRFERAGIDGYHWFVGDVSEPGFQHKPMYNLVLCDAPCSGSGTWGRTPEWLRFFTRQKITEYARLQTRIATRAMQQVKAGGLFLYITCSVFSEENEAVVNKLQEEGATLVSMRYFTGYHQKADTLFAALLRK